MVIHIFVPRINKNKQKKFVLDNNNKFNAPLVDNQIISNYLIFSPSKLTNKMIEIFSDIV